MAEEKSTPNNRPIALTAGDVRSLCDRLLARGASTVFVGQREVAADMVTAARTLKRCV